MKRNYSLKFTPFDGVLGGIALVLIIVAIVVTNVIYSSNQNDQKVVEMYLNGELLEEYNTPLDKVDKLTTIIISKEDYPDSSLLGDIKVDIDPEKGIRVYDVTCPNHVCENQGWVNRVGFSIACIPNGFFVVIKSYGVDEEIVLG